MIMPHIVLYDIYDSISVESTKDVLTEILREGAQKMLATAIEAEVDAYIDQHTDQRDVIVYRPAIYFLKVVELFT